MRSAMIHQLGLAYRMSFRGRVLAVAALAGCVLGSTGLYAQDRAVAITQEEGVYFLVDYHNWRVNDTIHVDEATWLKNWGWIVDRYRPYQHLIFSDVSQTD